MNNDISKLLSAVKNGKLNKNEVEDISNMLLKSLTPEQTEFLRNVTENPAKAKAFMESEQVKNILDKM